MDEQRRHTEPFSPAPPLAASTTLSPPAVLPGIRRLFVSLSARHLPPGINPLACAFLSQPRQQRPGGSADGSGAAAECPGGVVAGAERVLGHTEVLRFSSAPQWQRRLAIHWDGGGAQHIRIALFDATPLDSDEQRTQPQLLAATQQHARDGAAGSSSVAATRRSSAPSNSFLQRLSLRRSSATPHSEHTPDSTAAASSSSSLPPSRLELRSSDEVGCALLPLCDLCQPQRLHVQQRLPLRHNFDADIDRRLQRLDAHLLVTVTPDITPLPSQQQQQQQQQRAHSLLLPSASAPACVRLTGSPVADWSAGPSCALPFEAAYRWLCRGAEMWKFAYSSNSARPQRRLVFYAPQPLSAAQLQLAVEERSGQAAAGGASNDSAAPNPLFPLGLLYWCAPGKRVCDSARCVPLHSIQALYVKCQTAAFASALRERDRRTNRSIRPARPSTPLPLAQQQQQASKRHADADSVPLELGLSVVSPQRTLDLVPDSQHDKDVLLFALHGILLQHQRLCYSDDREAAAEEAKRTEERRLYNERQLAGHVSVAFSLDHLPLPAADAHSAHTQMRVLLSKQLPAETSEPRAASNDEARCEVVGSSEWVDLDEAATFARLFALELPSPSSPSSAPSCHYHLSLVDLSHRTLATASFSSQLLAHQHVDIPLQLRHTNAAVDSLLQFNRACAYMRVSPLTARHSVKADILDVLALLQTQQATTVELPYMTLAFLIRGEACEYYAAPGFTVQRTTLRYEHTSLCLQLAGHSLPLSSLLSVHRQLRPASELTDELCAVHPLKRVHSRRMLLLHTADSGSFVCEMRSVMAADAWAAGIRQLLSNSHEGQQRRGRTDIQHEQLDWTHSDLLTHEAAQAAGGESEEEWEESGGAALLKQSDSQQPAAGVHFDPQSVSRRSADWHEESELRVTAPHPTAIQSFHSIASSLSELLPPHSLAANTEAGSDDESAECSGESFTAARLLSVDWSDGHLIPRPAGTAARRLSHSSGLHSPFVHSRSASFSSLQQPGFHITPPDSPHARDTLQDDTLPLISELEPPDDGVDVPTAPSLLTVGDSSDIPCAPPLDVPAAPPLSADGAGQQAASSAQKLKRLHWDAISGASEARGTIFEALDAQLDPGTVEAIEQLFAAVGPQKAAGDTAAAEARAAAAAAVVEVIDRRRAQNVSIAVRGLKAEVADIVRALVDCDLRVLSVERLQQLTACVPDALEAKQLRAYTGAVERLGAVEQFMLALLAVPQCASRLQLLLFVATFDEAVSALSAHCELLTAACQAVLSSERLAAAMQGVLAVGGLLSGARAAGFRLSSLDKLHALKSQQHAHSQRGQLSLLDFIVERELSRARTGELAPPMPDQPFFHSLDLSTLHAAAALDWQSVQADMRTLHEQMRAVRKEADRTEGTKQPQHSRQPSRQEPMPPSASRQAALHSALRSFLARGVAVCQRLSAFHDSTASALLRTQSYFAESDGSAQSVFASLARFVANFTASERRYWAAVDAAQRKAAIEHRKQQMARTQQKQAAEAVEGQHFSYVDAKRGGDTDEQPTPFDSSRALSGRITYNTHDEEQSAPTQPGLA